MNEEIASGLKNALERGDSLDKAVNSFVNAGYNKDEVQEAALSFSQGATTMTQDVKLPKLGGLFSGKDKLPSVVPITSKPNSIPNIPSPDILPRPIANNQISPASHKRLVVIVLIIVVLVLIGVIAGIIFYNPLIISRLTSLI